MIKYNLKYGISLSLDVTDPNTSAPYTIEAPNPDLERYLRSDLGSAYGHYGHTITDSCRAIDLNVALASHQMARWEGEIAEGLDILESYKPAKISGGNKS
jgi:hypothetical protein